MYDESIRIIEKTYNRHIDDIEYKTDFWKHKRRVNLAKMARSIIGICQGFKKRFIAKQLSKSHIQGASVLESARHGKS